MYKFLLCLRYLRTRWIALASVVSVMLGVATLIVVNSVMGGFATEMRERVRGVLAHIMIEGGGVRGFTNADWHMQRIHEAVGDKIKAMTPVVETYGMLSFDVPGTTVTQAVHVKGVDPKGRAAVGKFAEYLMDTRNTHDPSFEIRPDVRRLTEEQELLDELSPPGTATPAISGQAFDAPTTASMESGQPPNEFRVLPNPFEPAATERGAGSVRPQSPTAPGSPNQPSLDFEENSRENETGIVVPWLLASVRNHGKDYEVLRPGDQVRLILPSSAARPEPCYARRTVVDRFKSGMSEYDQTNCYLDIKDLQNILQMGDRVTSIEIRLNDYADAPKVVRELERMFHPPQFRVVTWEQKQGPLLSAVAIEQGILNVVLFMIIAVAGFGILALFFMIVVEKTRDIGILKSLGASDRGVQGIFLWYGLALGTIGSGLGLAIGLLIVVYLDHIEKWLSRVTGHDVFNRDLYYFDKIPTLISPWNLVWVACGAMLIAVAASVLPARRAARLRPVQALRYE